MVPYPECHIERKAQNIYSLGIPTNIDPSLHGHDSSPAPACRISTENKLGVTNALPIEKECCEIVCATIFASDLFG